MSGGLLGGINTYSYVGGGPLLSSDYYGLSKGSAAAEAIKWTINAWKHVWERHICKSKNIDASKFKNGDPNSIARDAQKVVDNPDKVTVQSDGRTLYQRDMGRTVGANGETIQRVVVDAERNGVTTFPADVFKSLLLPPGVEEFCSANPMDGACIFLQKVLNNEENKCSGLCT